MADETTNEIMSMKNNKDVVGIFILLNSFSSQAEESLMLCIDAAEALAQLGDKRGNDFLHETEKSLINDLQNRVSKILAGLEL